MFNEYRARQAAKQQAAATAAILAAIRQLRAEHRPGTAWRNPYYEAVRKELVNRAS